MKTLGSVVLLVKVHGMDFLVGLGKTRRSFRDLSKFVVKNLLV